MRNLKTVAALGLSVALATLPFAILGAAASPPPPGYYRNYGPPPGYYGY